MSKSSGLGDNLYYGGYDLSGDIQSLSKISGSTATLDFTAINQLAMARGFGRRDGTIAMTTFFDSAVGQSHPVLSPLPTTDVIITYCRGTTLGAPAASLNSKQSNYDPTRSPAGDLTFNVTGLGNKFGLEWGLQMTAGKRTDTTATNGTSVDGLASTAFGAQFYLQVFAFTGTDVTVTMQDSADNSSFSNIASGAFTQVTSGTPQAQRLALSNAATVRRYVRAITTTSGGFTSVTFAVMMNRNPVAGVVF